MKKSFWISYDLGVSGDYEGMYAWLDDHGAIECGSSVAFVKQYHYDDDDDKEDLMQALESDIQDVVEIDKRTRIYVIRRVSGREKGSFLFGRRKGAPWDGYGQQGETYDDEA